MGRDEKLYRRLDEMIAAFQTGLRAQFEEEQTGKKTPYLLKKRRMYRDTGNSYHMSSWSSGREDANELLMLEKEIIVLCDKLHEAQPEALEILREYLAAIENKVKTSKGYATEEDDFGSWHVALRKQAIEKLKALA